MPPGTLNADIRGVREPEVLAVHLQRREAVLGDGRVIPITEILDAAAVAYGGPGEWFSIDLSAFTEKPQ